jgi:hypothetical protein
MSEFPVPHTQDQRHAIDGRHSNSRSTDPPIAKPTHQLHGGSPWGSLAVFGTGAGWGLAALGVVAGVERLLDSVAVSATNPVRLTSAVLGALFCTLAFCLAGWAVAAITRMMASTFLLCLEHAERASESRSKGISQAVAQLERLVDSMRQPVGRVISSPNPTDDRAQSISEIVRATRAADWTVAQTRLDELEGSYPNDPELALVREQLARARRDAIQVTLTQLSAAREVNDPDRVLEIYQLVLPALDQAERTILDQDLAKWFLSLIHRRLRVGKVQADVVHLATRFSETFASTVEGASVRASLATLRRSIGLCSRCGQPYTGIADACPKCLKAPLISSATFLREAETNESE